MNKNLGTHTFNSANRVASPGAVLKTCCKIVSLNFKPLFAGDWHFCIKARFLSCEMDLAILDDYVVLAAFEI